MTPHLGHAGLILVVVTVTVVCLRAFVKAKNRKRQTVVVFYPWQLYDISLALTCAGLHAIGPRVIDTFAAKSSAVLEPSSARSATTDSAGFPECGALWTSCDTMDRGGVRWRADRLPGYEFSLGYWLMRS